LKVNSASWWVLLYGYITMHGQQNIEKEDSNICMYTYIYVCMYVYIYIYIYIYIYFAVGEGIKQLESL